MTELDEATVLAALEVAVRAPSIHNTQPWGWELRPDGLVLRADRTRQLAVADPDGHSMLLSCGAALHLTELGLRAQGLSIETTILPDPTDPDVLALFRSIGAPAAEEDVLAQADAALQRRSDRRPFALHSIPDELVEQLQGAANDRAVHVHVPTRADERIDLAVAVSWADRVERDDEAYQAEMNHWLRDPDVHALIDGVPVESIPHVPDENPRHVDVPLRDFEVGVTGKLLIERDADEKPLIAVFLTDSDGARDHLAAGMSMMRFMIAAELAQLSTCPLSQAVDFAEFRTRVRRAMGWVGAPQMMLRVGYPNAPTGDLPRTPRRTPSSVLTTHD